MTAKKILLEYLKTIDSLFVSFIRDHEASFKKEFVDPIMGDILEIWVNETGALLVFSRQGVEEFIEAEALVDWMLNETRKEEVPAAVGPAS